MPGKPLPDDRELLVRIFREAASFHEGIEAIAQTLDKLRRGWSEVLWSLNPPDKNQSAYLNALEARSAQFRAVPLPPMILLHEYFNDHERLDVARALAVMDAEHVYGWIKVLNSSAGLEVKQTALLQSRPDPLAPAILPALERICREVAAKLEAIEVTRSDPARGDAAPSLPRTKAGLIIPLILGNSHCDGAVVLVPKMGWVRADLTPDRFTALKAMLDVVEKSPPVITLQTLKNLGLTVQVIKGMRRHPVLSHAITPSGGRASGYGIRLIDPNH